MKNVLILGGTNFIGRVLVEKMKTNTNYSLTLFNRGKRNAGLFPEIPQLHGDRETDEVNLITGNDWDFVIDLSGYYPVSFAKLLEALKGKVGRYIFVSTISVYDLDKLIGREVPENETILPCTEKQLTSKLPDAYGEKKAEMERLLLNCEWLDKIIFRPSLVYGKYDFTDRFYYWLWRAKFSDKILLPDEGKDITSITFVSDLADLLIASLTIATHRTTYNAATHQVTIKQLAEACAKQVQRQPQFVSLPAQQITNAGVQPWQDIALWMNGDMKISMQQVLHDFNIAFTPFAETVAQTAAYYESLGWPECKYGMKAEKEIEFLSV
jgi:2'-hydroxyisoflavone reductase